MTKIILATKSPYRKEAFGFLGFKFTTEGSKINEQFTGRPKEPRKLVKELARLKAEVVAKNYKQGIVIGFDSVGYINGKVLEKPRSKKDALKRLKLLSNKKHQFYTGIYMINIDQKRILSRCVVTDIVLRKLTNQEMDKYLDQDPKFNTYAIGFDPWGYYSSSFATELKGSYNNYLRGIPLEVIVEMLFKIGYKI